jgi:hypothetical protein
MKSGEQLQQRVIAALDGGESLWSDEARIVLQALEELEWPVSDELMVALAARSVGRDFLGADA